MPQILFFVVLSTGLPYNQSFLIQQDWPDVDTCNRAILTLMQKWPKAEGICLNKNTGKKE